MTSRPCRGFTLVELLSVIAVMAILIGLAFPSLQKARASARNVQCLAKLRKIAAGFSLYAADHDGWLPTTQPAASGSINQFWHRQIAPYLDVGVTDPANIAPLLNLNAASPYLCPEDKQPYSQAVSYGMNGWLGGQGGDQSIPSKLAALRPSCLLVADASNPLLASKWTTPPIPLQFRHAGNKANAARVDGSLFSGTAADLGTPDTLPALWKP